MAPLERNQNGREVSEEGERGQRGNPACVDRCLLQITDDQLVPVSLTVCASLELVRRKTQENIEKAPRKGRRVVR
jgi:hypothetical protein